MTNGMTTSRVLFGVRNDSAFASAVAAGPGAAGPGAAGPGALGVWTPRGSTCSRGGERPQRCPCAVLAAGGARGSSGSCWLSSFQSRLRCFHFPACFAERCKNFSQPQSKHFRLSVLKISDIFKIPWIPFLRYQKQWFGVFFILMDKFSRQVFDYWSLFFIFQRK